jgi:hypothetical protein
VGEKDKEGEDDYDYETIESVKKSPTTQQGG